MLTSGIDFLNFKIKVKKFSIKQKLVSIIKEKNQILDSLGKNYNNNFNEKILRKYKKSSNFRVIGMGGSTLGTQTIYDFLKSKIKKNFSFIDNLQNTQKKKYKKNSQILLSQSQVILLKQQLILIF